jgi:hypothetical protein
MKDTDITAKKQQRKVIGKPFKEGVSGNPAGRPKGSISITTLIKQKLQEVPKGKKKSYAELLVDRVMERAIKGDYPMIRQIWSYIDGMPKKYMGIDVDKGNLEELTNFFRDMSLNKAIVEKYNT